MASIDESSGYDLGGLGRTDASGARQQSWQDALAQQNAMQLKYPVDPANGLHYAIQNGKKLYFPPIETPEQYLARTAQQNQGLTGDDRYYWNQETGKFENGTDWLKVATLAAGAADAGAIAYGAAGGAAPTAGADTLGDSWAAAPASAGGAGFSSGAAAGAGAAGATGAAATGTGAAAAPVVAGTGTVSTVAPVVAGAGGPAGASLWSKIAAPVITTGINAAAQYYGTKAQIDAQQHAADVQAKYLQDALDWQKAQLAQRRTDLTPAINTGSAATYKLGDLMGLPATSGPYAPPTPAHQDLGLPTTSTGPANNWSPSTPPSPVQPGNAQTGNQGPTVNGQPQMVALRSPNGTVGYVPFARVNDALAAGAQRV